MRVSTDFDKECVTLVTPTEGGMLVHTNMDVDTARMVAKALIVNAAILEDFLKLNYGENDVEQRQPGRQDEGV